MSNLLLKSQSNYSWASNDLGSGVNAHLAMWNPQLLPDDDHGPYYFFGSTATVRNINDGYDNTAQPAFPCYLAQEPGSNSTDTPILAPPIGFKVEKILNNNNGQTNLVFLSIIPPVGYLPIGIFSASLSVNLGIRLGISIVEGDVLDLDLSDPDQPGVKVIPNGANYENLKEDEFVNIDWVSVFLMVDGENRIVDPNLNPWVNLPKIRCVSDKHTVPVAQSSIIYSGMGFNISLKNYTTTPGTPTGSNGICNDGYVTWGGNNLYSIIDFIEQ